MFRRPILSILALTLAAAASLPHAADGDADRSFHLRSETPALVAIPAGDGFFDVRLEGYRPLDGPPGTPDLPVRTVLIALPPGATPRLEVHADGPLERRPAIPRPVASYEPDPTLRPAQYANPGQALAQAALSEPVASYAADPRYYEGTAVYPERVAWLGDIGVLRDQRYVPLHLAPARFDAASGEIRVVPALEVTVHFDGAAPLPAATPAAKDSRFEAVYRRSFANYEQGRRFRVAPEPTELPAPVVAGGAETPRRRIVVREDGMVRLDYNLFLNEAPEFLSETLSSWRLDSRGVQVPLQIRQLPGDANLLEPGEWVAFYGQKFDEDPKTVLNADNGGNEDLYEVRDFTDDSVYFLSIDPGPQPEMTTREAAPAAGTPPTYFDTTAHVEVDDVFLPRGNEESWFWSPYVIETAPSRTDPVPLPGLLSGTAPLQFRVQVRGTSSCGPVDPDHITRVSVKNNLAQTLKLPVSDPNNDGNDNVGMFDARTFFLHDFAWTHSGIQPIATNPLLVTLSVDDVVGCTNDVLLDWIEIDYRRSFSAVGDTLTFDYPNGDADFQVTGLSGPPANVFVYEVTDEIGTNGVADAVRLTSVSVTLDSPTYTARFRMDLDGSMPPGTPRRFVVVGAAGASIPAPADFAADRVSLLVQDATPADLIVVSHPDLLDSLCSEGGNPCDYDADCTMSDTDRCELDPTSELAVFLAHRASQGVSSRVARIGDVEDDFNAGMAGPLGIVNLVDYTISGGWGPAPPSFLLLLGDGSVDYKSGTANGNFVPTRLLLKDNATLGFFSSDNLLGAVAGDDSLPELVVGRIAVRTLADAETVLEKIRLYEQTSSGPWRSHAVFISDRGKDYNDFEAKEFERINAIGEGLLGETANYTSENLRYWSDNCLDPPGTPQDPDCDIEQMRQDIQDAINGISGPGAALAQFIGHGNFILWSDDVLFCVDTVNINCDVDDMESLFNAPALPWLLAHNCLTGGFHSDNPRALGEDWLERGVGGAIAVFAPSGLGYRFLGEQVVNEVWADLFGPSKERSIAVPVLDSLVQLCATTGTPEGCQFYTLLGDPSMTLALPKVAPATAVQAVPGNAVVQLSWTASPDGAAYDVYRSQTLGNGYTKVNGSPILGTTYDDTSVFNGTTYFYYVVALDIDGFESPWSNTNTDCATLGPDCVTARPLNPFPPSIPTGLTASDAETGGRIDLSWNANPEVDFKYYTVHWGPTPEMTMSFTRLDAFASITGLVNGELYYVAVDATNTSDLTSDPSTPDSAVPTKVLGLKAPALIGDLHLGKSGNDAALSWSEVTTDIYGKPKSVTSYEVYRGTVVDYVPDVANRIGTSATADYDDAGALTSPDPAYFYLVRGLDAAGTGGGLGRQLPDGIGDLQVSEGIGPNLTLSWSPVTTDFDDAPTAITHYVLYDGPQPFSRADIRDGNANLLLDSITTPAVVIPKPAESRYYSVLAVDTRGNLSPF